MMDILLHAGLSFRTTEESLRNAFETFGQLVEGESTESKLIPCFVPWICLIWFDIFILFSYILVIATIFSETFIFLVSEKIFYLFIVNLVMDKIANRPRGFAFLRYSTEEESEKAIEGMHGKVCNWYFYHEKTYA